MIPHSLAAHTDRVELPAAIPAPVESRTAAAVSWMRQRWVRRVHALLGLISACNLFVLISTGLLLQHTALLRLDERTVSRRVLPSSYRPQDGKAGVRFDIVVTDVHSGRIFGVAGLLVLDGVTLAWFVMMATGLVMYFTGQRNGRVCDHGANQDDDA